MLNGLYWTSRSIVIHSEAFFCGYAYIVGLIYYVLMNNIQTYLSIDFDVQFWSRLKVIKEKVKYYARAHSEANTY